MTDPAPHTAPLQLEVGTIEEFIGLLERRERDAANAPADDAPLLRRAVCLDIRYDQRDGGHGIPHRTRYVLAAFAYGPDLVTLRTVTSRSLEMSPPAGDEQKLADVQKERFEEVRRAVEALTGRMSLSEKAPVIEGRLGPAAG